jgi:hypothetical protein
MAISVYQLTIGGTTIAGLSSEQVRDVQRQCEGIAGKPHPRPGCQWDIIELPQKGNTYVCVAPLPGEYIRRFNLADLRDQGEILIALTPQEAVDHLAGNDCTLVLRKLDQALATYRQQEASR